MRPLVALRLVLVLAGIALFGLGIRDGSEALRWAGIGCIAVSVAIRLALRLGALRR
ncbi:MAG: hypothetical protein HYX65_04985 [Gemmatimonadetes bacterium]|nr:hypothetical protein [Gemmatimonadota bacterium]